MVIKTEDLKNITTKILPALDSKNKVNNDVLEIYIENQVLYLNITNKEYFVSVKLSLEYDDNLRVAVNASSFLNLISQITTEDIELTCDETYLKIKGNGSYKLPLIYEDNKLYTLPRIDIHNITNAMTIDNSILQSILKYNSKEIQKPVVANPVQKMYYIDENGAITFTTGACVNEFKLEKPIKILLTDKIVKLFKLFKDEEVQFTMGYDAISDTIIQTKVKFEDSITSLTAILQCDDTMLRTIPVTKIVQRAQAIYPYKISVSKNAMIQAINRIMALQNTTAIGITSATFEFSESELKLMDNKRNNIEPIPYITDEPALKEETYTAKFDLNDFKNTLSNCEEAYLTLRFGDSQALVITRNNLFNIIPEIST